MKRLSPEILHVVCGQGFHVLETNNEVYVKGEHTDTGRGLRSWRVINELMSETWENPAGAIEQVSNKLKRQGGGRLAG